MMSPKDVLLIGYGAVGAIYSLILKNSGRTRVTVVARGNYQVVNATGINFRSRKYGNIDSWRPDRLFSRIDQALDRPYSYVVLATKAIPELQRTPALLASFLSPSYSDTYPQPTYVLLQNGLNVEVDLYNTLKTIKPHEEPKIISTAVWIGTGLVDKNVVEHNEFDRVSMGVYRPSTAATSNTAAEAALLEDFASILAAGGSETTVVPEIQRIKFTKNMWNGVLGASATLARLSLRAFFRPPHLEPGREDAEPPSGEFTHVEEGPGAHDDRNTPSARATAAIPSAAPAIGTYTIPFLYDALTEMYDLGAVLFPPSRHASPETRSELDGASPAGVPGLDRAVVDRTLANAARLHARPDSVHVPSMLLDVEAGRPMEVEHVLGELVRMGRRAGVSMPRIETLYALLLVIQNQLLRGYTERRAKL